MASRSGKIESGHQEWDMEFKDPFSLEEDECSVYCSGVVSQPTATTTSCFTTGNLVNKTLNDSVVQGQSTAVTSLLLTATRDHQTATTAVTLPNWKPNSQHNQIEVEANASAGTTISVGSKRTQRENDPFIPHERKLSHDTNEASNLSERDIGLSEEQLPIPVISSAKRFCASEDIENNENDACFDLPMSPSASLSNSPVSFAQPEYPLPAYNIPAWPTASLSLPVNNSGTGPLLRPLLHSTNIPILYNQSPIPVVNSSGATHWPGHTLHLPTILTNPPPPVPPVSHAAVLGLPASDFSVHTVPLPQLNNGVTSNRLPLATLHQLISAFSPPNVNRLPFSTSAHSVLMPQQSRPHNAISGLDKSDVPPDSSVNISASHLPHCDTKEVQQTVRLSYTAQNSAALLSAVPERNTEHNNDKSLPNLFSRTLPVTSTVTNLCPPLTSANLTSKQTVTVGAASQSSVLPPQMKFSSTLDPRIHNGNRKNATPASQSQLSANAASTKVSAFVVPVPPPLPSLEELTADRSSEELQKDDKDVAVNLSVQTKASASAATDSAKLDRAIPIDRTQIVAEQVRATLKPFFKNGLIDKDAYKEIMRKAVPKICASRSADISTTRVQSFIDAYVAKVTNADRRKNGGSSSSSSTNRQESL